MPDIVSYGYGADLYPGIFNVIDPVVPVVCRIIQSPQRGKSAIRTIMISGLQDILAGGIIDPTYFHAIVVRRESPFAPPQENSSPIRPTTNGTLFTSGDIPTGFTVLANLLSRIQTQTATFHFSDDDLIAIDGQRLYVIATRMIDGTAAPPIPLEGTIGNYPMLTVLGFDSSIGEGDPYSNVGSLARFNVPLSG